MIQYFDRDLRVNVKPAAAVIPDFTSGEQVEVSDGCNGLYFTDQPDTNRDPQYQADYTFVPKETGMRAEVVKQFKTNVLVKCTANDGGGYWYCPAKNLQQVPEQK